MIIFPIFLLLLQAKSKPACPTGNHKAECATITILMIGNSGISPDYAIAVYCGLHDLV
jgi:hypothetical protein